MMSQTVQDAINRQINSELSASYSYLAMSAYCESRNFPGCARWLRLQSQEEHGHALRLLDFLLARNGKVDLKGVSGQATEYPSIAAVFDAALKQEAEVSGQIDALYELAFREKSFSALAQLNWFLTEQVEEEKTARQIVAKFQLVGNDPASLLDLDRELGSRTSSMTALETSQRLQ
jgi:ferritin